jgi:hypothetical protein|uniref:Uncharacterized protein n=1 Tax=Siphoviridae sp. ct6rT12 TaxID=2825346 RepID=A0A8S5V9F2_9CAUD|nr:MAG TPA: hypothetical protein [Siphoviridae sp. ct6rT12]
MKILTESTDWNTKKEITVCEENGKLYVTDNFMTFGEKKDIDKWLSVYEIFYDKDNNYNLVKSDKKLFEMGIL